MSQYQPIETMLWQERRLRKEAAERFAVEIMNARAGRRALIRKIIGAVLFALGFALVLATKT